MIKVGILGSAAIARRSLAPAFAAHPAFELTAIASRTFEKAADFASIYDGVRPCGYEELLVAKDVDFIYCPLPTGLHYPWVMKALESDKHVLCEKSLACTRQEVESLVAAARRHGRFLMESFQFRFHAQNLFVRDLLAKKSIGEVRQMIVRFGIPPFPEGVTNIRYSKELGGGALLDNGAYTIKAATYFFGPDVAVLAVMSGGGTPALGNVDLTGALMLRAGDVPIQTAFGFDHFYQNGYEIWGTGGKISTVRAFTARNDFAAPVFVETAKGREERTFLDDHFARLLDYIAAKIGEGDFEGEYAECLQQAKILEEARTKQ